MPAEDGFTHLGIAADTAVRPDDGAVDDRVLLDLRLPAEDGIGADACPRLDQHALVDEAGALDDRAFLDAGILGHRRPRAAQAGERRGHVAAVHDVAMDLGVLLGRADVDPVAVVDVGHEGLGTLDQRREVAAFDRPGHVARNPIEGIRLQHVDPGVDVVRGDLVRFRLLQEARDVAVAVGLDEPVGARVLDRGQYDRRLGLALPMELDDRGQIDLRQHVAVEHDDRIGEVLASVLHRASRTERHGFDDVADLDPDLGAIAEHLLDAARLVVEAQDDLVDFRDLFQQVDLVVEKRPIEDRNDGFRGVNRERPKPRALTPSQEDRFHDKSRFYCRMQPPLVHVLMNLPNSLPVVRMFLVPLLVVALLTEFEGRRIAGIPKELVAAGIFGLASLTDWLDGYLARRRRQVTWLGQMLDPIADKLLTSAAFISLVQLNLAPAWIVAIIIGREFAITALRSLAYSKGITIPASPLGKIKMASQVTAILLLILGWGPMPLLAPIGYVALWVWLLAASVSAVAYSRRFQVLLNARVTDVNIAREHGQRSKVKGQRYS